MPSISWDNRFSTGIPGLDSQNKHFIEKVNLLIERSCNARNKDCLRWIFQDFSSYVQDLFKREELFYGQYEPQELDEHLQQHFLFQENLNNFSQEAINKGANALRELTEFIKEWVVFHILYLDSNIASSIRKRYPCFT